MKKIAIKGGDFAQTAYNASATFGRVVAFFQMIAGVFFGIIFFIIGVVAIRAKPDPNSKDTSSHKGLALTLILVGLLVFFSSIIWFIITLRYKMAAAATGAYAAVDWTTNAIMD